MFYFFPAYVGGGYSTENISWLMSQLTPLLVSVPLSEHPARFMSLIRIKHLKLRQSLCFVFFDF